MTRAKRNLSIHLTGTYLDHIRAEKVARHTVRERFDLPKVLAMQLSMNDVFLGTCVEQQHAIEKLQSGDRLAVNEGGWVTANGSRVLKFSRKFMDKYEQKLREGYRVSHAKVNFVVWWYHKDSEEEVRVVLPELYLQQ